MKRGLIAWDRTELPPVAFEARLASVREAAAAAGVAAVGVYTDVWRSNQARFLANFMPYFNRSLLVIPAGAPPVLLCGLSPRVYPWIRRVSVVEDVRPAGDFARALRQLADEQGWARLGIVDLSRLPVDLHRALAGLPFSPVDIPSSTLAWTDDAALVLHRQAARLAREALRSHDQAPAVTTDVEAAARLERVLRRAGAEDLRLWVSDGRDAPAPARGVALGAVYSVTLAVEYRGHWAQVSRVLGSETLAVESRARFERALDSPPRTMPGLTIQDLSGPYPFQAIAGPAAGPLVAIHVESLIDGRRLVHGDTCLVSQAGSAAVL